MGRRLSPRMRLAIKAVLRTRETIDQKQERQLRAAYAEGRKDGAKSMLEFLQKQQAEAQAKAEQSQPAKPKQETRADLKDAKTKFAKVKQKRAASR